MPNRVTSNRDYPRITQSDAWYDRAQGLIPAATQTLAKGPGQFVRGVAPKYLLRGEGSHVWDVDGNEYLDFSMGVGPISLGYRYPAVDEAIRAQLGDGITFSLMHPLEVEVAELVHDLVPGAECVRFGKTGAEVASAAVRLARAFTGRNKILCCGYHGWHDWYIAVTDRRRGVPSAVADLSFTFDYNDATALEAALDDDVAAVILEPVTFDPPRDGFLERLRELTIRNRSLLIFDEMWTGFRLALGGAQERFGIAADLACFSKAVANGMPLSVLTGRREVMELLDEDVFFFSTFGGETLSLAAARATLLEMRRRPVIRQIERRGEELRRGIEELLREYHIEHVRCVGFGCRTLLTFDAQAGDPLLQKSLVQQELFKRGILWGGIHNISFSHSSEDIEHTLGAYAEVLPLLADACSAGDLAAHLRGQPVRPVFRRATGFNIKPRPAEARR
jgi:glutamate-1-semialdehyde aminotransferase